MIIHTEVGLGIVDGANTTFFTSKPYQFGTVMYLLNGLLKVKEYDDGFVETDPLTGEIQLKEAPLTGDVVQFTYIVTSATDSHSPATATVHSGSVLGAASDPPASPSLRGAVTGRATSCGPSGHGACSYRTAYYCNPLRGNHRHTPRTACNRDD